MTKKNITFFLKNNRCKMSARYNISEGDILEDLANYRGKGTLWTVWSKEFVWKSAQSVSPIVWWKGTCSACPLSKVAVDVLSLPATSAACERSFSVYGNIHSAKRNRLGNETAMKFVYIAQILKFCASEIISLAQNLIIFICAIVFLVAQYVY